MHKYGNEIVQSLHSGSCPPCCHCHGHEQKQQPNSSRENETTTE